MVKLERRVERRTRGPDPQLDLYHGRFGGEVVGRCPAEGFLVEYSDGDSEHLSAAQLVRVLAVAATKKGKKRRAAER